MAHERTYPCLPCRDISESIAFYQSMGFARTYLQTRPNPYAVVALEDMHIHLFGIDGFDPAQSYGTVIVAVPDPDGLYRTFAAGLKSAYGKLPVAGIPRLLRPRKRYGTVRGFSVVDPGGNWLRISRLGDSEDDSTSAPRTLKGVVEVAARLADSHGDEARALSTLDAGLKRHADAPALERGQALLYRAELEFRTGAADRARASLAEAHALPLNDGERASLTEDFTYVTTLLEQ